MRRSSSTAALISSCCLADRDWRTPSAAAASPRSAANRVKAPPPAPDWRITCIFVDRGHRGQGIARTALAGALEQVAERGVGLVEAISEVTQGREAQGRFLLSATVELF